MVSVHIVAALLELLIGVFVGFYFTDRKQGLSFNDVKIASIMLLTLYAILMFTGNVTWVALLSMVSAFVLLFSGILLGEYIRIRMSRKVITKTVRKEDIHATISDFLNKADKVALGQAEEHELHTHLSAVQKQIDEARLRIHVMKQPEMFGHLNQISDTCNRMAKICVKVRGSEDVEAYRKIGSSLSQLTLDTLNELEFGVTKRMSKPIGAVVMVVKTTSIK